MSRRQRTSHRCHPIVSRVTRSRASAGGRRRTKYTYDVFGQPTILDGSGAPRSASAYGNRFQFTGREWLAELGLYDYRNRMFSPMLGRFLQPDPIGFLAGDVNIYRYCGNNASNMKDPFGLNAPIPWDLGMTGQTPQGFIQSCYDPPYVAPPAGYMDLGVSFGRNGLGFAGGVQISGTGVYPYLGFGAMTPGPGATVLFSAENPSSGWSWSGSAQYRGTVQYNYQDGKGSWAFGAGVPKFGASGTMNWTWGPYLKTFYPPYVIPPFPLPRQIEFPSIGPVIPHNLPNEPVDDSPDSSCGYEEAGEWIPWAAYN